MIELAKTVIHLTNSKSILVFRDIPVDDPKQRKLNIELAKKCLCWKPTVLLEEERMPELQTNRAKLDAALMPQLRRVWDANWQVYGADKVWNQMNREGIAVARCTVERLMNKQGLCGVRRGKVVRTATPDTSAPCPLDRVNRQGNRPQELKV